MTRITVKGARNADEKTLAAQLLAAVLNEVGVRGWAYLSPSHREGLVAREGLSLLLTQVEGSGADVYRRVARIALRAARASAHVEGDTRGVVLDLGDS